jgi:hypothetical protein
MKPPSCSVARQTFSPHRIRGSRTGGYEEFWLQCSPLKVNRCVWRICRLHLQGWRISQARNQRESRWQVELCLETSVDFEGTTRRYVIENRALPFHIVSVCYCLPRSRKTRPPAKYLPRTCRRQLNFASCSNERHPSASWALWQSQQLWRVLRFVTLAFSRLLPCVCTEFLAK